MEQVRSVSKVVRSPGAIMLASTLPCMGIQEHIMKLDKLKYDISGRSGAY